MEQLAAKKRNGTQVPQFRPGPTTQLIAQIIKADFGTRIFYTSLDGFDTHANQLGTHAALLQRALRFGRRLSRRPRRRRPGGPRLLLTFSEFGRRVEENASQGDGSRSRRTGLRRGAGRPTRTRGQPPEFG